MGRGIPGSVPSSKVNEVKKLELVDWAKVTLGRCLILYCIIFVAHICRKGRASLYTPNKAPFEMTTHLGNFHLIVLNSELVWVLNVKQWGNRRLWKRFQNRHCLYKDEIEKRISDRLHHYAYQRLDKSIRLKWNSKQIEMIQWKGWKESEAYLLVSPHCSSVLCNYSRDLCVIQYYLRVRKENSVKACLPGCCGSGVMTMRGKSSREEGEI